MKDKPHAGLFYAFTLLSLSFVNGAVSSDSLIVMLFFWEGLMATLFGLIIIGNKNAYKTAVKFFILIGLSDLCLMFGIGLTGHITGTYLMSKMAIGLDHLASIAFLFLMIGAVSKAGSMPFHSWIPDAAVDADLPFMALIASVMEKLLGVYLLKKIAVDMFKFGPESWLSPVMMTLGLVTLILAIMMALIQKDFKRFLSYQSISGVGYIMLGIGTGLPVGIVGGIFHTINHALYKSCLFLTAGSVEKQTGTTDLNELGGLGKRMPVTFFCFMMAALAGAGVPPFNSFFSKELIYDGALERGKIFYGLLIFGSFLTIASFLKLGHAAFLGKGNDKQEKVKEAPWAMLIPMVVLSGFCLLLGLFNKLPIDQFLRPVLFEKTGQEVHAMGGMPSNWVLVLASLIVLVLAFVHHLFGVKKTGKGIGAADHIRYAPVLNTIYDGAEARYFDPYEIGLKIAGAVAYILWFADRAIDWIFSVFTVKVATRISDGIRDLHSGSFGAYLLWSLTGFGIIIFVLSLHKL